MGKPDATRSTSPLPGIAGSSSNADAVSLHTQPGDRMYDDDVPELQSDDLPPLYSDIEADSRPDAPLIPTIQTPSYILGSLLTADTYHKVETKTGTEFLISRLLDDDPTLLERQMIISASKPPRPAVRIHGTHSEVVREKGKSEKKTITDFDVSLDLTPYLTNHGSSWMTLRTVEDTEKTCRGTILRKRAPGVKRDLEITNPKPSLAEWCHRYCASHAGVKSFALQRRVVGFNEEKFKNMLVSLVRGTNYRGDVAITFPVKGDLTLVYNESKINRWRLTPWIVWMCYLTFLWLLTWPFLFFRTKKFEVAVAEWPFSKPVGDGSTRYISMSEDHIYNMWARAINRAVLDKRECILDQGDLMASQNAPDEPFGAALEGAPGFIREGLNALIGVNRQFGWGGHQC